MRFSASNEIALHVADPGTAEAFYTNVLGCTVFDRSHDCISMTNGRLRLYLVRDPVQSHEAVVPSFDVMDRQAAIEHLQAEGCALVPIGPHAPGDFYVRDPFGILFDVMQRNTPGSQE